MGCEQHKALEGLNVLVIEDNADYRLLTEFMLASAGANVEEASNGEDGYAKALVGDYSLVLLDAHMPGMDGNDLVRRLRHSGYDKPVVALTAAARSEDRRTGLAAGHDAYLVKPIAFKALVDAVAKYATRT